MFVIKSLKARQILDSRGNPTVEVDLSLACGAFGRAAVPSGASVGSKEALELRDDNSLLYFGKGVLGAVANVNELIKDYIIGKRFDSQKSFDQSLIALDGTSAKAILGANAILAVSIAFAKASANQLNVNLFELISNNRYTQKMPMPMMNFINGGVHADNMIDIQEFMIVPKATSIAESLEIAAVVFQHLKASLKKMGHSTNVGDEGGFAPNLKSTEETLEVLATAIIKSGFALGREVGIALDIAASELFINGFYHLKGEKKKLSSEQFAIYHQKLIEKYNICSIEDPMAENDLAGWKIVTDLIGDKVQIVGDDIFVTNKNIFEQGIKKGLANALLVKMNQVGTLTETLQAVDMAYSNGYETIVSHRSGETEDTTIAHLAVGIGSKYIKAGSICRTDRVCKYNELLRIAEHL